MLWKVVCLGYCELAEKLVLWICNNIIKETAMEFVIDSLADPMTFININMGQEICIKI